MKLIKTTFPFIIFIGIAILLWRSLFLHPTLIPSPLINKPVPVFQLPALADDITTDADLIGHITLLNVWATWCYECQLEHEFLMELSKEPDLMLYGLNYKDDPETAKQWLKEKGNPFKIIAVDQKGQVAIDWGVYGTPETFLIDKEGVIRYKLIGRLTQENWQKELKPLIQNLRSEQ